MACLIHGFLLAPLLCLLCLSQASNTNQYQFFNLMTSSLSGNALSDWKLKGEKHFCNFNGVVCDDQGYAVSLDITGWSLSGQFPSGICSYLPNLRALRLASNDLRGNLLNSFVNCSFLEELNMSFLYHPGTVPDLSPMRSLRILDLSYNKFTGNFPISITNLSNIELLDFNENDQFNLWRLPENISRLPKLKSMILTTCQVEGRIPASIGNMTVLEDLELSGNFLNGEIPAELGLLKNLKSLELYYNELTGNIPPELGNLKKLEDLDMSVNQLTGKIPESICSLPHLKALQIYNNSLSGEIPSVLGNSTALRILSLYRNFLTGELPQNLGHASQMTLLDVSENRLSGRLPPDVCKGGNLLYFLVLENMFTGGIPSGYANCSTLIRFRVNSNLLEGPITEGILGLPHVSIIDISNNNFIGPIASTIGNAKNLSELFMQNNEMSGVLPPQISGAVNLVKIDLSNNKLSGPIPSEVGHLRKLNLLLLENNKFNSSIPKSLSSLKSLNVLDLSSNRLTGKIPDCLGELLPNSINFSNNLLSGPIPPSLINGGLVESFAGNPGLCVSVYMDSLDNTFPICPQNYNRKKLNSMWAIIISAAIIILGALLFLRHRCSRGRAITEHDETPTSLFSYDVKSFHRISFNQHEIVAAMVDKNIVGHGGSGTVYKIELRSGEVVAVKKLWSHGAKDCDPEDNSVVDKELKSEVQTLGSIRHKNIVKLYCCFSSLKCNFLVYEYMTNGNLHDALHKGFVLRDWPTRHRIALGIAQGLAYLHHDLMPPIIHRDVKSSNILLDVNYQPKVADFGIAKVFQARGGRDYTTSFVAGTYGYMAPERAFASGANTKSDVYSFGVVLMELITGKEPVGPEIGDSRTIVCWVSTKVETREGTMEVLDKRLSGMFVDQMIQALRVAIRCTQATPGHRPTMNEVVQMLIEADPCKYYTYKTSENTKEASMGTKTKETT